MIQKPREIISLLGPGEALKLLVLFSLRSNGLSPDLAGEIVSNHCFERVIAWRRIDSDLHLYPKLSNLVHCSGGDVCVDLLCSASRNLAIFTGCDSNKIQL